MRKGFIIKTKAKNLVKAIDEIIEREALKEKLKDDFQNWEYKGRLADCKIWGYGNQRVLVNGKGRIIFQYEFERGTK